jgi:ferritin-like metal-binding protein YciE
MAVLGKTIESPRELFVHKLGATLTMEETILEMLEKLQEEAQDAPLRRNLGQHHRETQGQVRNLHQVFRRKAINSSTRSTNPWSTQSSSTE